MNIYSLSNETNKNLLILLWWGDNNFFQLTDLVDYGYKRGLMEKINCIKWNRYRQFKIPKNHKFSIKTLAFSITFDKYGSDDDKIFKEKDSLKITKVLCLINNNNMPD